MVKSRASSSSAELRAFRELAELLAPGVRAVAERVALAVEDPAAYVKKHARELGERGVTKPIPRLPLVALLDGIFVQHVPVARELLRLLEQRGWTGWTKLQRV